MKRHAIFFLVGGAHLVLLFGPAVSRAEYPLDEASKRLVYCIDVYAYAAHWKVINKDPAAARDMARQFSRATVGLFSLHYDGDRVANDRIAAFKAEAGKAKPYLDAHPSEVVPAIDSCTVDTNRIYQTRVDSRSKMFGKSLDELIDEMAAKQLRSLGL